MKVKNKTRLLKELAKESKTPKEFIEYVMALQNQTPEDVVKDIDMTIAHFYVVMCAMSHGANIGVKVCVKISKGLDIDPAILNRLVADYNLSKYLKKQENGTL
jgi:hypothetical protein